MKLHSKKIIFTLSLMLFFSSVQTVKQPISTCGEKDIPITALRVIQQTNQ